MLISKSYILSEFIYNILLQSTYFIWYWFILFLSEYYFVNVDIFENKKVK